MRTKSLLGAFLFASMWLGTANAQTAGVAYSFSYQAYITDGSGNPMPNATGLTFEFQILDPNIQTCLLYDQTNSNQFTDGASMVSINVGSPLTGTGSNVRTIGDPGRAMSAIFANNVSFTGTGCSGGYTPLPGDSRVLRVIVTPAAGTAITLSPDVVLGSVPQAFVAETLQGFVPGNFILTNGPVTQTNMSSLAGGTDISSLNLHTHDAHNDGRYMQIGSTISTTVNTTQNSGTAITGTYTGASSSSAGVAGTATSSGTGVEGTSSAGVGVNATSTSGDALQAVSTSSYGVVGTSSGNGTVAGVYGTSLGAASGVVGNSASGWGVGGSSSSNISGFFQTTNISGSNGLATLVIRDNTGQNADLFQAQNTGGSVLVNISATGKLGIGNPSPNYPLDVNGAINSSTGVYRSNGNILLQNPGTTNTLLGVDAGPVTTGANNTVIGNAAGIGVTSGTGNTVMGTSAAPSISTDSNNTIIGYSSDIMPSTGGNAVAVGTGATSGGGAVAIGADASAAPSSISLGFASAAATSSFVAGSSVAPINTVYFGEGSNAANPTTYTISGTAGAGSYGGGIEISGGPGNGAANVGGDVTIAGGNAGSSVASGGKISFWTAPPGTGLTIQPRMLINASGNVGIGTTIPHALLDVAGHIGNSGPIGINTTCGTLTNTFAPGSNDTRGNLSFTGSPISICTINFGSGYASTPTCVVSWSPAVNSGIGAVTTTSTLTVTFSASQASASFNYICMQ